MRTCGQALSCFSLGSLSCLLSNLGCLSNCTLGCNGLHDELDDCHGSVVTLTVTDLDDAGVTTGALCHCRSNNGEELVHDGLVGDGTQHATASSQVALLTEGDEALCHRTQALCLGQGGGDALVLEQLRRQVVEHVALVGRGTAEAGTLSGSRHS